jgi:hypothetical protein
MEVSSESGLSSEDVSLSSMRTSHQEIPGNPRKSLAAPVIAIRPSAAVLFQLQSRRSIDLSQKSMEPPRLRERPYQKRIKNTMLPG